jgi:uncharacterized repeat protein (TIGR03803 family)
MVRSLLIATAALILVAPSLHAQKLTVLHAFTGMPDGSGPVAAPIRDKQGNLYSTTFAGGTKDWGTVYEIDTQGKETILHSFLGGADGITPASGLVMDAQGNLYGTTYWGGNTNCFHTYGCGVVYELSPGSNGWKENIIYVFHGGSDGAWPEYDTLVFDAKGNLYGTTLYGGIASWPNGSGVVFKLTHTADGWKEQVVYAFGSNSQSDGANPYGGVTLDDAGNIYGTTYYGGTEDFGTVFKITPSGAESVLHNFTAGTDDGAGPMAAPVLDAAGNLYGGANYGGDPNCSCGVIYKIDTSGAETGLHTFTGYPKDGASPDAPLVRDNSGNLYGTTYYGGNSATCLDDGQPIGCGTVFQMTTSGKERIFNLNYQTEGNQVFAGVLLNAGTAYGAASNGGSGGQGTIFKITK